MEATFYHDDAGDRGSANTLKRKMTLDFDSAPKRSKQQKLSSVLQSPDLNMLKLASPELERMIIQANGMITTPTPTQFIFPKFVTEEQEAYARGFVDALAELKADEGSPTGAGMEFVSNPSISYKYLTTSDGLRAITTASSLRSLHGGIINPTNRARTLVKSEAPQLSRPSVSPLPTMIDLKEEPQTVPCLSSTPPPLSPINMESQETLKLERKRARNRVAARKCRTRKLERISRLEDRVNGLKDNNTDLSETASSLKEQVFKLKQQIVDHVSSGCQIMMTTNLGL